MGKSLNKVLNYLIAAGVVIVAAIFINSFSKKNDLDKEAVQYDQSSMSIDKQQEAASNYMKELQYQQKRQEIKSLENLKRIQEIKRYVDKERDRQGVQVPREQQITKEQSEVTPRAQLETRTTSSTEGVVIGKENAQDFIETARRNGYHVILSPNYEVISITPIMNSNRQDSFESNPSY